MLASVGLSEDEIIDLKHSVDPAYRLSPSCAFMMHDSTMATVRKLKDSQSRYLWELSTIAGEPDRLDGFPVIVNNDMASALTTGQKLVLFGDFRAYHIQDAGPVVLIRGYARCLRRPPTADYMTTGG